ncbi:TM0106 family RecB-like putative nuclease [Phyllobacterium bourgognense]|uniref:AAA+ ATPase domain-containing protein n=1 Tax=Phyllobacterium bourgognense TaxID=314236 RepID=A0A368Z580_9HYPH|nr:TM0106 family RecB-like putative nuclease [Phyllobacterium bourgognense]RCW87605.1 uncharacterized protein C7476_101371 [Phyllobacterium bourgognense]
MKKIDDQIQLSATDLVGHLNCHHLTALDVLVANGSLAKPKRYDPMLEILRERGFLHEQAFVEHLLSTGLTSEPIDFVEISDESVAATIRAMQSGRDVIIQGALRHGRWSGRTDVLRRVEIPSAFGGWSYEVMDTKLARETKGGTVLQLCLYSDLLGHTQQLQPANTYVVAPWSDFIPQVFRIADYAAYFRKAKVAAEIATSGLAGHETYPEPNDHCEICRWFERCDKRRRHDDHLSFVAGISRTQIAELRENGVTTLAELGALDTPLRWKPKRGTAQSYEKIRAQARIQADARESGVVKHELLPVIPGYGLCLLPKPSEGDIFFDLEGDPFIGEHGLEYLFGYHHRDSDCQPLYKADWSLNRQEEKSAFEAFIDFVIERLRTYPDLHIYHFAPYEPTALKRLMGRYATREAEIDNLLRGHRFVDLYSVVRNSVRASVESYSIKRLEIFYGYERLVPLKEANVALASLGAALELGDVPSIKDDVKTIVQNYNKDDCVSTEALRSWLERLRLQSIEMGAEVLRPNAIAEEPNEKLTARQARVKQLADRIVENIPVDSAARTDEQQAVWILANILDWHRREEKAVYWEKFRLQALSSEELLDERAGLSGLTFAGEVAGQGRTPTHRYHFPQQDTDIRAGKELRSMGGEPFGKVVDISTADRTIDIKKQGKTVDLHPAAVFTHEIITADEQAACLLRIGDYVADHGVNGEGPYLAARDLLLRSPPQLGGQPISIVGEDTLEAAIRLAKCMQSGVLPIQGPPGTGKSYTGARMICQFVQLGMKVGIAANSHKVIRNLLDKVIEAADEVNIDLRCIHKAKEKEEDTDKLFFAKNNGSLLGALATGQCQVAGATGFLWAREDAFESIDVLVVDEAAQISLANVLALSQAAKRLILLGDPQQLDQPSQGTHPDGTDVSGLAHILNGKQTIEPDQGLFLEQTWRMNPDICSYDSELFYGGKLHPVDGCQNQTIHSQGPIKGSGLRYVPVQHTGNKSFSIEEADAVQQLVLSILSSNTRWIDRGGNDNPITIQDIVIITPYNAQVFEIQQRLPAARVGTVDKFQGQEAPIAIYSMATSSHADAPRGMEFLYSANRLNVAISRAKCLAILVASPAIFEAECKTPGRMQLANAFCRFQELAKSLP